METTIRLMLIKDIHVGKMYRVTWWNSTPEIILITKKSDRYIDYRRVSPPSDVPWYNYSHYFEEVECEQLTPGEHILWQLKVKL